MEDHLMERLIERAEKFSVRNIDDIYKKIEESVEFYRDFIKSIDSEFDGYDMLDNLENVRKEIDELVRTIRNTTDDAIDFIRRKKDDKTEEKSSES